MADADDPAATTYPQSSVEPLLPNEKTACNSQLPGGEVVEWFDFGQFVELLAVDAAGKSHPVVLANHEELARAAGEIGQGDAVPLRMVDIVGGIPLTEIADEDRGSGERALAPIAAAREIIVGDVDALIATGAITVGGITYKVTLTQDEARRLRDGEHITHAARASEGAVTRDVIVSLAPTVYDARVADVEALLAARTVEIVRDSGKATVTLALEPAEVTAMLAASTVIVRATAGEATVLVRLTQLPGAAERPPAHPARTENQIDDVAAFLANPVVDGDDGRPFPLQLTKEAVHELRTNGTTTIQLDDRQVTVSTVRVQNLVSTVRVQNLQQRNGGTEPNGGKEPKEREEPPPTPSPKEQTTETVTVLTAGSVEAESQVMTVLNTGNGVAKVKKWLDGKEPLPSPPPPPPPRPPFSLRVALFLPWRQTWTMKGLSRGRLLQSLSLAPQEETTIELQTWERHRKTLEQSMETDTEQNIEATDTTKDTSEVYGEVQRQSDFQYQVGGSMRATYRPAAGEIEIGANAQLSGKSAVNQVGRNTQSRLHEAVVKASTKVRTQRTTKITETVEFGSEQRVSRTIRNPNLCHTLNLDYYEVLAHYDIVTEFRPVETTLCAMVLNPISIKTFDEDVVRGNETALRDALLDRALVEGFDACRLLGAYQEAKLELVQRKADAANAVKMGAPDTKQADQPASDPVPTKQQADVLDALKGLKAAADKFAQSVSPEPLLDAIGQHLPIGDSVRRPARQWMYKRLVEARFPNFASALRDLSADNDAAETAKFDRRMDAARRAASAVPAMTGSPTLANLGDLTDAEKEASGLAAAIHKHMGAEWDWAWWSGRCREEQVYAPDDMGVPATAQRLAERMMALDSAPAIEAAEEKGKQMVDQADRKQTQQSAEDVLEMKFGLEDVGRARERKKTLLAHLNDHLDYYRFVLFQALPPSEQLERLMNGSGGALRVGMFEPRVVSMHGPFLAVPLHSAGEAIIAKFRDTIVATLSTIQATTSRVMLPTPGMTIESRLGRCSACEEYIEESREIELRRLTGAARQVELEADRMQARLAAKQLGDPRPVPEPVPVSVRVENPNGAAPAP